MNPTGEPPRLIVVLPEGRSLPTFDQWLELTGYDDVANRICAKGTLEGQLTTMRSLYGYYRRDVRRRLDSMRRRSL